MKPLRLAVAFCLLFLNTLAYAQTDPSSPYTIFDDKMLLEGYCAKYENESKEMLLAMIEDDTLSPYKSAAAVRIFKDKYSLEIFSREKNIVEKILLRRLNHTDSPFVEIEVMHTLCLMDRYKYFKTMVPALIKKMDHYNETVNEFAFAYLKNTVEVGHNRTREARIIFNTLRKVLFLSRRRLSQLKEPTPKLKQKFELLRWAVKVLGSQELKRLPKEVINLL